MDWGTVATSMAGGAGTAVAVLKVLPYLAGRHAVPETPVKAPVWDMSLAEWDDRVQANVLRVLQDKLGPILQRQTEIINRMVEQQDKLQGILSDNTTALQVFLKLEEQRDRLQRGG